ncbi:agouti-related protein [Engraulis encrasicolus]|uniref:agouti-related protein n=1 Tax=Engraulis encrasicolus TaxID=184585 RepID=UPI002FD507CD
MSSPLRHCWWMLILLHHQAMSAVRTSRMADSSPSLRMVEAALLSTLEKESQARERGDPFQMDLDSIAEELMDDPGAYDEDGSQAMMLQGRSTKAPRRCVPHQQSCLGHQTPCCDPCDTCYCRFFKAYCYCRSMDATCSHGHGRA